MGVIESAISVIGTLVGVLAGFLMNYYRELRGRKHEKEMEYRKEIRKHMNDLIKPLFVCIQNLWGSIGVLMESLKRNKSIAHGKSLNNLLREVQTANQTLQKFVHSKYEDMSLLLPTPLPWIFVPLDELINYRVIEPISQGKKPIDDMTVAVNSLMTIQKDLRSIVGFEVDVEVESVYPFNKAHLHKRLTNASEP